MLKSTHLPLRVFFGRWRRAIGIFWLAISSLSFANERHVTVLPLDHAVPEQVVPVVKNLLSHESTVSGYNNQLILNVLPAELKQVEILLKQIDKPARQLLISVRTPQTGRSTVSEASIEGTFADGKVQIGESKREGKVRVHNSKRDTQGVGNLTVQATEGLPAYVSSGQERLVRTWKKNDEDHKEEIIREYRSADRGFYVVPRVLGGNRVSLEIQQTHDKFGSHEIDKRRIVTTVSGNLGEWIQLGSMGLDGYSLDKGTLSSSSSASSNTDIMAIKVEEI